ncbi:UNVERIFIED_ORG: penicillin-insensitive murein endopeptidase [Xanthobacter viscosus]|uniref:Penicillin-insensitive murein endopeptidase n=1 Tax=Xanthobacter autotrophicus TaxID=280 RepID=A0A6C1KR53_XANAU|nr:penicillin-insensitive murein endopeptidase [Xanthobacter autotrophicus]TLX42406.1 penicillin-insensitive murein endopeptidase [Xanthobacter autotrophicus]
MIRAVATLLGLLVAGAPVLAQQVAPPAAVPGKPAARPAAAGPLPAKELFGRVAGPAPLAARSIGFYSKGCLAGAQALAVNGPNWQVMRLSRNRNFGHPDLVAFLERFSAQVPKVSSWQGILVGDMSQPRGGPMLTGHASHQIGLDADIWLTPSPGRELTREEREKLSASMMVRADRRDIDPANWRPDHWKVVRAAALDPRVERIFVNAAIKKALCREASGDRSFLAKVRPYWGHDYHMHVRLTCPPGNAECRPQEAPPTGEGCGSELDWWFTDEVLHPKPEPEPAKPKPPLTLADLPDACAAVLGAK